MTNWELRQLWEASYARSCELEMLYRAGFGLSRQEANELRRCTLRMGIVAQEAWIQAGRPDDPIFDTLREPIKLSALPAPSMSPLDLSGLDKPMGLN